MIQLDSNETTSSTWPNHIKCLNRFKLTQPYQMNRTGLNDPAISNKQIRSNDPTKSNELNRFKWPNHIKLAEPF